MGNLPYPTPLYTFLRMILQARAKLPQPSGSKILDCGAGGETPPLGLFHESGFETWGIDISPEQLQRGTENLIAFCFCWYSFSPPGIQHSCLF